MTSHVDMTAGDPGSPLVTVCIPLYNKVRSVSRIINDILAQPHRNIELVISDNGSTDGSTEIAREFASHDSRIRYFRIEKTIPVMEHFRYVIMLGKGDFCKVHSADDPWNPDFIPAMIAPMLADPSIEFTVCHEQCRVSGLDGVIDQKRVSEFYHKLGEVCKTIVAIQDKKARARELLRNCWHQNMLGNIYKVLFRPSCIPVERWKQMADSYPMQQSFVDWDFLIRLFLNHRGAFVDQILSTFEVDERSPVGRIHRDSRLQIAAAGQDFMMPFTVMVDPTLAALREHMSPQDRQTVLQHMTQKLSGLMNMAQQHDANSAAR